MAKVNMKLKMMVVMKVMKLIVIAKVNMKLKMKLKMMVMVKVMK